MTILTLLTHMFAMSLVEEVPQFHSKDGYNKRILTQVYAVKGAHGYLVPTDTQDGSASSLMP